MPVSWSDADDAVLAGDLTAALAYFTPARSVVVTPVAPVGLRDRERGTVSFTSSLGFGRKLDRIRENPRVALAFHAREHGFATGSEYLLVQGRATFDLTPDPATLQKVAAASARFLGPPRRGRFWDRWLRQYYQDRVVVTIDVQRIVSWPDLACSGEPTVTGAPLPERPPRPQAPPKGGTAPRLDAAQLARPASALPHVLAAFAGADGYPVVVPVHIEGAGSGGMKLSAAPGLLPPGGRRAGLLAHSYRAHLVGLVSRVHTGWLDVAGAAATFDPFTERGFRAPANKTLLLLANGLLAKRALRRARRGAGQGHPATTTSTP